MPSLQHEILSLVVPRLRRERRGDDLTRLREQLIASNRTVVQGPPRRVRRGHDVSIANAAGFPVFTIERTGSAPIRSLFYLHGGGYVRPSDPRHWLFACRLADALGARVVFPTYPLAPEFTFLDSHDALADVLEQAVALSPGGVVLVGDSAGGGLALALAATLRDRAAAGATGTPSHLVLIAPWVDLTGDTPGPAAANIADPWLSEPLMRAYAGFWAGSPDRAALADPRVSPLLADLRGLPPALLFVGTRDLLEPGCRQLFERAEDADWPLEYVEADGLIHDYPLFPIPEAAAALNHAIGFLSN